VASQRNKASVVLPYGNLHHASFSKAIQERLLSKFKDWNPLSGNFAFWSKRRAAITQERVRRLYQEYVAKVACREAVVLAERYNTECIASLIRKLPTVAIKDSTTIAEAELWNACFDPILSICLLLILKSLFSYDGSTPYHLRVIVTGY